MCTAIFAFGVHSSLLFLLAFNRDEFFARPTQPVSQWEDLSEIIAPRDLLRRGTWLGISKTGRLSFLTNYRVPNPQQSKKSRGDLPVNFMKGIESPVAFLKNLESEDYGLFNLLTARLNDGMEVAYLNPTHDDTPQSLSPGVHGFSNGHKDDTSWNKVETGKQKLQKLISNLKDGDALPWDEIFDNILGNSCEVRPGDELPNTGVAEWRERRFSAMKILPFWNFAAPVGLYGTRSQIVIAIWKDHRVELKERILDDKGRSTENELNFMLSPPCGAI